MTAHRPDGKTQETIRERDILCVCVCVIWYTVDYEKQEEEKSLKCRGNLKPVRHATQFDWQLLWPMSSV